MIADETEVGIWNRTIQPEDGNFPPEAAQALLNLRLAPADVDRVNELSAKAREGDLSEMQKKQLDNYLNVGRALELLKAKARLSLR